MLRVRTQFPQVVAGVVRRSVELSVWSVRAVVMLPLLASLPLSLQAQSGIATPPAYATIKEAEIKADMFAMAGDAMRGREGGTLDEMRASMWVGDQYARIGLKPMGDNGTWYQWFNMRRSRVSTTSSSIRIAGKPFALWTEATPTSNTDGDVLGTTVFAGDGSDSTIDVRGKVAVVTLKPTSEGTRTTINTPEYRAVRQGLSVQGAAMTRRGAAAVIIVADDLGEANFDAVGILQSRGTYTVPGGANRFANPQEHLIAALNACMAVGYAAQCAVRGITLESLAIETDGEIDLRGFLGIDPAVPPGYENLSYTVRVKGNGTSEQFAEVHQAVMATSPNFYNISRPVTLKPKLVVE